MTASRGTVSFDLDGTLWEFEPMMEGALAAALGELERARPDLAGALTVAALHEHRRAVGDEPGTLEELRRLSLRRALASVGAEDEKLADWLGERLLRARARVVEVHDDVEPALAELAEAGYVLGAITNGNFPVHELPLASRFRFIVHAEQAGAPKPEAAPFRHALEACAGAVERWVHVGDDPLIDVAGAQAFGMRAVWLNRLGVELPEGVSPDAEVESLGELPATVERLLGAPRAGARARPPRRA